MGALSEEPPGDDRVGRAIKQRAGRQHCILVAGTEVADLYIHDSTLSPSRRGSHWSRDATPWSEGGSRGGRFDGAEAWSVPWVGSCWEDEADDRGTCRSHHRLGHGHAQGRTRPA